MKETKNTIKLSKPLNIMVFIFLFTLTVGILNEKILQPGYRGSAQINCSYLYADSSFDSNVRFSKCLAEKGQLYHTSTNNYD